MKRSSLILALGLTFLATVASANAHYDRTKLTSFEKTNKCAGCDLSYAPISTNHSAAVLNDANLSNIFSELPDIGINFSGANLQNANLTGAKLFKANLSNADLTG